MTRNNNRISVKEIQNLYSGRTSPTRKEWLGDCAEDLQRPQFRQDQHGKGYCPFTPKSWVHGGNATARPGFDHSPKRGSERR
jgi:hypothetical protein